MHFLKKLLKNKAYLLLAIALFMFGTGFLVPYSYQTKHHLADILDNAWEIGAFIIGSIAGLMILVRRTLKKSTPWATEPKTKPIDAGRLTAEEAQYLQNIGLPKVVNKQVVALTLVILIPIWLVFLLGLTVHDTSDTTGATAGVDWGVLIIFLILSGLILANVIGGLIRPGYLKRKLFKNGTSIKKISVSGTLNVHQDYVLPISGSMAANVAYNVSTNLALHDLFSVGRSVFRDKQALEAIRPYIGQPATVEFSKIVSAAPLQISVNGKIIYSLGQPAGSATPPTQA